MDVAAVSRLQVTLIILTKSMGSIGMKQDRALERTRARLPLFKAYSVTNTDVNVMQSLGDGNCNE